MADDNLDSILRQYYGVGNPDYFSQTKALAKVPPKPTFPGDPSLYQGSIQNLPDRPEDPVEAPVAESLSPTMGAYGMGQALADTYANAREGHWNDAAKMGLPLLGMFAGVGARTADMAALAKAHEMAGKGLDRGNIWNETGWFQGPDEKWRFEIPDNKAEYASKSYRGGSNLDKTLPDVMRHDALYAAYPDLQRIMTAWRTGPAAKEDLANTGERAVYFQTEDGGEGITAQEATPDALISPLLHEAQHAIQYREGFVPGGNTEDFTYQNSPLFDKRKPWESPWDAYRRVAGEVEARNVQRRQDFTPIERRAIPPWETQDVPDIDQILRETYPSVGRQMSVDKDSSVSGNPSEQVDTSRPLTSNDADPRYKGFDTSAPLYHSTKADFTDFQPNTHFGTTDQANMRTAGTGARVIPVYPKEGLNYAKGKDAGDWSQDKLARLARQGYDGVRYLNRYEGIPLEAFDRARAKIGQKGGDENGLDKLSDSQFKKLIPEAQESVIVFDPKKNVTQAYGSPDRTYPGDSTSNDVGVGSSPENRSVSGAAQNSEVTAGVEPIQGIRAYHGSPHDFDKFDMSKIGTGEGAQAYGHGLYFAESPGVAKSYRDDLGITPPAWGLAKEGRYYPADEASYWGVQRLNEKLAGKLPYGSEAPLTHADIVSALGDVKSESATLRGQNGDKLRNELSSVEKMVAGNPDLTFMRKPPTGRLYEVNINAHPDQFLDWDKPLSQQTEPVRTAMTKIIEDSPFKDWLNNGTADNANLGTLYGALSGRTVGDVNAGRTATFADKVGQSGIPGIRYLDQGSRSVSQQVQSARDGLDYWKKVGDPEKIALAERVLQNAVKMDEHASRNYVVFNPDLIEILKKYGIAAPIAGAGALSSEDGHEQ